MGIVSKATAAAKFETGDRPTQQDFADFIDSTVFIPAGITGVIEVESTASSTNRSLGAFGVVMIAAGTTASAQGHLGISSIASANAQGAVGVQILSAGTTASAQGHLGAGAVGTQLLEAAATASALNALGGGTVGIEVLSAVTTASAVGHLGMISLSDSPQGKVLLASKGAATAAATFPSNARRITVLINGMSLAGSGRRPIVQFEDSSGYITSYIGNTAWFNSSGQEITSWTTGIMVSNSAAAAHIYVGRVVAELADTTNNTYSIDGQVTDVQSDAMYLIAGGFTATSTLTGVRVTTSAAATTFDNGSISLIIE